MIAMAFIVRLIFGGAIGVVVTALCAAQRRDDDWREDHE